MLGALGLYLVINMVEKLPFVNCFFRTSLRGKTEVSRKLLFMTRGSWPQDAKYAL